MGTSAVANEATLHTRAGGRVRRRVRRVVMASSERWHRGAANHIDVVREPDSFGIGHDQPSRTLPLAELMAKWQKLECPSHRAILAPRSHRGLNSGRWLYPHVR